MQEGVKNLRLIALLMLCLLISCGVERPRHESPVPLDESKPTGQGICPVRKHVKEANWNCLVNPNRSVGKCKVVGCSKKPKPISDVCKQLRSEYASSGRVQWGLSVIVRYNHDPIISDKGDWWPTQEVDRIKLREVCYEGIELETISSRTLESVRKQSSQE